MQVEDDYWAEELVDRSIWLEEYGEDDDDEEEVFSFLNNLLL